jgi:hypothetical protein
MTEMPDRLARSADLNIAEGDAAPSLPTRPTRRPRETGPTSETATNELEES